MSDDRVTTHGLQPGLGGEFTLCGMAFDFEDESIVFAKRGETFNCEECREFVRKMRAFTLRFIQP